IDPRDSEHATVGMKRERQGSAAFERVGNNEERFAGLDAPEPHRRVPIAAGGQRGPVRRKSNRGEGTFRAIEIDLLLTGRAIPKAYVQTAGGGEKRTGRAEF